MQGKLKNGERSTSLTSFLNAKILGAMTNWYSQFKTTKTGMNRQSEAVVKVESNEAMFYLITESQIS